MEESNQILLPTCPHLNYLDRRETLEIIGYHNAHQQLYHTLYPCTMQNSGESWAALPRVSLPHLAPTLQGRARGQRASRVISCSSFSLPAQQKMQQQKQHNNTVLWLQALIHSPSDTSRATYS